MDTESLVQAICAELERHRCIQGIFLGGSLANDDLDAYSDIDLGVVSGNNEAESDAAFALRGNIVELCARPVHVIERGWEHCRLIAALYGKSIFPPVGLELDVIFSQLQHIGEQMAYSEYRLLFDRTGLVAEALKSLPQRRPRIEAVSELRGYIRSLPFWVHDAEKSLLRGDLPQFQTLLDAVRQALFSLAAVRRDALVYGSKRGLKYLSPDDRALVAFTYGTGDSLALQRLVSLLVEAIRGAVQSLGDLDPGLQEATQRMEDAVSELL